MPARNVLAVQSTSGKFCPLFHRIFCFVLSPSRLASVENYPKLLVIVLDYVSNLPSFLWSLLLCFYPFYCYGCVLPYSLQKKNQLCWQDRSVYLMAPALDWLSFIVKFLQIKFDVVSWCKFVFWLIWSFDMVSKKLVSLMIKQGVVTRHLYIYFWCVTTPPFSKKRHYRLTPVTHWSPTR